MSENRCPQCGTLNRLGARFCARCGNRLDEVPPTVLADEVPPYSPAAPQARPAPRLAKSGWLGTTANLLAWVCAAAFVVLISLALPILNTSNRLFDSSLYKEALVKQDVYNRFPDLFADQMVLSQPALSKETNINFGAFTRADWKLIAQELVTPQWVQKQTESLMDEVFAAAQKGAAPPALKISLQEVSDRLTGDAGFRIYKEVIQTKPECNLDDIFTILDWMDEDPQAVMPVCHIPEDLTDFIGSFIGYSSGDDLIKAVLKDMRDELPADMELSEFFTLPMNKIGIIKDLARVTALVCVTLAALALLLVFVSPIGRTLKGWLLLWGLPLAGAGLICLVIALSMPSALAAMISSGIKGAVTPALSDIFVEVMRTVTKPGASALTAQAAGMLFAGVVMSGASAMVWGIRKVTSRAG